MNVRLIPVALAAVLLLGTSSMLGTSSSARASDVPVESVVSDWGATSLECERVSPKAKYCCDSNGMCYYLIIR